MNNNEFDVTKFMDVSMLESSDDENNDNHLNVNKNNDPKNQPQNEQPQNETQNEDVVVPQVPKNDNSQFDLSQFCNLSMLESSDDEQVISNQNQNDIDNNDNNNTFPQNHNENENENENKNEIKNDEIIETTNTKPNKKEEDDIASKIVKNITKTIDSFNSLQTKKPIETINNNTVILKEGYMMKKGTWINKSFQKRYFKVCANKKIFYYKNLNEVPRGIIDLNDAKNIVKISANQLKIITNAREWHFSVASKEERDEWYSIIQKLLHGTL